MDWSISPIVLSQWYAIDPVSQVNLINQLPAGQVTGPAGDKTEVCSD